MGLSLFSNCANLLYFLPVMHEIARKRNEIEKDFDLDKHIGPVPKDKIDEIISKEPKYKEHQGKFLKYHGYSSILNMFSLVGSVIHLYCLAGNLSSF